MHEIIITEMTKNAKNISNFNVIIDLMNNVKVIPVIKNSL